MFSIETGLFSRWLLLTFPPRSELIFYPNSMSQCDKYQHHVTPLPCPRLIQNITFQISLLPHFYHFFKSVIQFFTVLIKLAVPRKPSYVACCPSQLMRREETSSRTEECLQQSVRSWAQCLGSDCNQFDKMKC